jgi:hypothetical protein
MFSKETYIDRRVALSASVSSGLIVMLGNEEMTVEMIVWAGLRSYTCLNPVLFYDCTLAVPVFFS